MKNAAVKQFYEEHDEMFQRINDAIMAKDFSPIRRVYIDLTLVKDTRLGTLIAQAPSKKMLNYLIEHLNDYNHDILRKIVRAYPEYPMGELELSMIRADPQQSERIFNVSPDTNFSLNMIPFFQTLADRNLRADYRQNIVATLNTFPLKETPFMRVWRNLLHARIRDVRFEFITKDPRTIPASFWRQNDVMVLDDFVHLVEEGGSLYASMFEDRLFMNTRIYVPYQASQEKYDEWIQADADLSDYSQYPLLFSLTEEIMSMWTHLRYMDFGVPAPKQDGE